MIGTDVLSYEHLAIQRISDKDWQHYSLTFITAAASDKLLIRANHTNADYHMISIDDIKLTLGGCECTAQLCGPETNNLIADGGFEAGNGATGWKSIFRNYDNRRTSAADTSNSFWATKTPVKSTHSSDNDNKFWMVLTTMFRPGICFFCSYATDENGAQMIKLKTPTIPGQTYRLSFMAATANPWRHKKAHINAGLRHAHYCDPDGCSGQAWHTDIPLDFQIYDNFKLDGKSKEWTFFYQDITADDAYQWFFVQAQDGVEPALDDMCLTADPFRLPLPEPKLYYTTNTSVRHVGLDKTTTTVNHVSDYDLFSIEREGNNLIVVDNAKGILRVSPDFTSHEMNTATTIRPATFGTDTETRPSTATAFAVNYGAQTIPDLQTQPTSGTALALPVSMTAPFSLARAGHLLLVAGGDQIALFNTANGQSATVQNHGVTLAGFMDFGDNGRIYIAEPGADAIRVIDETDIQTLATQLANGQPLDVGALTILTQGGLLQDALNGGGDHTIRGPIGVDHFGSTVWVTVDGGTNQPGRIVEIDDTTGAKTLFLDNVEGPRDLVIWQ
ncbi:MAG: hypothetical protein ACU0A6_04700 [Shimia sp.]|uniref:hypothetical protein n=1 Tax=Shimia sp. TaxID=1954381 RepID=UPI004059BE8B